MFSDNAAFKSKDCQSLVGQDIIGGKECWRLQQSLSKTKDNTKSLCVCVPARACVCVWEGIQIQSAGCVMGTWQDGSVIRSINVSQECLPLRDGTIHAVWKNYRDALGSPAQCTSSSSSSPSSSSAASDSSWLSDPQQREFNFLSGCFSWGEYVP